MQLLPTKILDWVNPKKFNQDNCSNDSSIVYFLEVDPGYLIELYGLHMIILYWGKK